MEAACLLEDIMALQRKSYFTAFRYSSGSEYWYEKLEV